MWSRTIRILGDRGWSSQALSTEAGGDTGACQQSSPATTSPPQPSLPNYQKRKKKTRAFQVPTNHPSMFRFNSSPQFRLRRQTVGRPSYPASAWVGYIRDTSSSTIDFFPLSVYLFFFSRNLVLRSESFSMH